MFFKIKIQQKYVSYKILLDIRQFVALYRREKIRFLRIWLNQKCIFSNVQKPKTSNII